MKSVSLLRCLSKFDRSCGVGFLTGSQARLNYNYRQFSSSGYLCQESSTEFTPNSLIEPKFVNNRNPRNLEKLRIGEKPSGWLLERESRSFWNKVTLDISSRHITATIVHYLGRRPVIVSTKEWSLKKYLYSTNDASAAKLVGKVLAMRCLQTGIAEVACFFSEEDRKKEKVNLFLSALENGGVALKEPEQVFNDFNLHDHKMLETPWSVYEDVDDKYSVTAKLRSWKERTKLNPKPYKMEDIPPEESDLVEIK